MLITKKHKLYFRDHRNNSIKRLDKVSKKVYLHILNEFLANGADKAWAKLNDKVTTWEKLKPLPMQLPQELKEDFDKILGSRERITISYNGSWRPLVELTLKT